MEVAGGVVGEVLLGRTVRGVHHVHFVVALGVGGLGVPALVDDLLAVGGKVGVVSNTWLKVSCLTPVPLGFILKISASPVGLLTPFPVVRSLTKTTFSGEAASARCTVPASATAPASATPTPRPKSRELLLLLRGGETPCGGCG
jgi:hypothetical protein